MSRNKPSHNQKMVWLAVAPLATLGLLFSADNFLQSQKYSVEQLVWEGPFKHVSREQLEKAVLDKVKDNYFTVNLREIEDSVRAMPWVEGVSVGRVWPKTIKVSFREQELMARWGRKQWVNREGEIVNLPKNEVDASGLPRFSGPAGSEREVLEKYRQFGGQLASVSLSIRAMEMTARHMWRLQVADTASDDGASMTLFMDGKHAEAQLARFLRVYREQLEAQVGRIEYVDLRYPNGFALKQRETEAGSDTEQGKKGV